MKVWSFFFCVACLVTFDAARLSAADLHAILVADYFSQDIKQASHADIQKMQDEIQRISIYGDYTLKSTLIAGSKSCGKNLVKTLKDLKVKNEDLIIFYFSGHGYRTSKDKSSPWPFLDFPLEHAGVSFKAVIDAIQAKGANLSIVIADCCNWEIPHSYAPPLIKNAEISFKATNYPRRNYRKLFCKSRGLIAFSSASPGQPSYCTPSGSFFTRAFVAALHDNVSSLAKASWKKLFIDCDTHLLTILKSYQLQQNFVVLDEVETH